MMAHLRFLQMHATCHVLTVTLFPEDVCRGLDLRSLCTSRNCGTGTLKHGTFEFERGQPKREGGGGGGGTPHGTCISLW